MRLKIIDLAGGDQPIVSDDGGTAIVFNGEIYNHREIRRELEAAGAPVPLALRHGDGAAGVSGVGHGVLRADARDVRGGAVDGVAAGGWCWRATGWGSSRCITTAAATNCTSGANSRRFWSTRKFRGSWTERALDRYLSVNYVPGDRTLIEGIRKVPPGHLLEWQPRQVPSWSGGGNCRAKVRARYTLEAAKEELDGLLRECVREHLVSDVPLGVWASGGVDSSTILHYAAEQSGSRLKTFSVSFRGRSFDESPYFREVAQVYGTDHHEFDLNPETELESAIERFRVLLGRAERGRGSAAGLVSVADDPAARDGGAIGRRRG